MFEKIPPIQYENKLNVQFDHKCDTFVSAMYTKNPFTDDNIEDLTNQDSENDNNWPFFFFIYSLSVFNLRL